MRWIPGGDRSNVEDRRGSSGGPGFGGGMRLGLGGMLVLLVLSVVFKQDFFTLLSGGGGSGGTTSAVTDPGAPPPAESKEEHTLADFVVFVLNDAQKTWAEILPANGGRYQDAHLVLFRDGIQSACGFAQTASGPFYCPGDGKVYIDLGFFQELRDRFGASGEFAEAYVVAHELGHHVQRLLGIEEKMRRAQRANPDATNQLSVALELQADCFAGIWGHTTQERGLLDPGEVEQGLNAAAAVGDDRIQRMGGGSVNPDAFTHGSSAQRQEWFKRGFDSGDIRQCDTFSGGRP
ncbi:MAG: neutral zinc metallopeptidase [Gemmatimonadota bacterium]